MIKITMNNNNGRYNNVTNNKQQSSASAHYNTIKMNYKKINNKEQ